MRSYYLCFFRQGFSFYRLLVADCFSSFFAMSCFMNSFIQLHNVDKSYREGERTRTVLMNASLEIEAGETVALLGRSGSGKSTILNLLSGIDNPDAGKIIIGGTRIDTLSEHDRTMFRRKSIGFVFQFFNLLPTLTVEENILLPLELNATLGANDRREALNLLGRVGLEARAASFPDRLSGGEQQRVAVVRALVHKPLLLLADEPTGNLDSETGAQVLELMLELIRERGATLLMATHSMEVSQQLDRIITVRDEKIANKKIA
jgi:putative ABC transport system ATP-binding protein